MDPLLSRLLLKTNDLRDQRQAFTVLTAATFNACLLAAESDMTTGDATGSIYIFDDQNMQRNLLLLETLQTTLNGKTVRPHLAGSRQIAHCRKNLRKVRSHFC
jgi:hypothetical protein